MKFPEGIRYIGILEDSGLINWMFLQHPRFSNTQIWRTDQEGARALDRTDHSRNAVLEVLNTHGERASFATIDVDGTVLDTPRVGPLLGLEVHRGHNWMGYRLEQVLACLNKEGREKLLNWVDDVNSFYDPERCAVILHDYALQKFWAEFKAEFFMAVYGGK